MLSFPGSLNWSYIIVWGFIAMLTFIDPNFYQRTFAGRSTQDIQRGICISVLLWFIFDIMSISVALYAAAIVPDINHSPYLDLILIALPPIAQGLFIISLLSVVMSTVDSFLFISGCTIGKDILPLAIQSKTDKTISYTKLGIVISGIISVILATFFENALDIWYVSGSFAVSSIMIPLLCVLYQKSLRFPLAVILIPGIVTLFWFLLGSPSLDPMYPGLLSSFICFLIFRR
jgi:SSS family solute:Na+ symporter